ncbi:O-methyltransferase [Actinorhabdospora filicis]|uniref:O-methyltransferase n=1 Tax=Actinorhabdospora filicis TaxID=1785913 RepID=A0A9W6SSA1_9ACTN|nr:O-methyltransferase [Actinorhabdospora filicis]GLZ81039.1 O-methyltransferase [Actinorhabdospora filicis]
MSRRSINLIPELDDYARAHSTPTDPLLAELIEETYSVLPDRAQMQISPEQSKFLTMLSRTLGVRHAVEIGTFTGMSSLSVARGMAADGKLICFDISEEFTSIARAYWDKAGVADRIELRIGDAKSTLDDLDPAPVVDLAFIDADKTGYPVYWEKLAPRIRPGGYIIVDNVFQGGRIIDDAVTTPEVIAMRAFNDAVAADDRFDVVMLSIADGLTLAQRK